jgi:hypothetical protein
MDGFGGQVKCQGSFFMTASMAEEWKGGDSYGEQGSYERKGGFGSIEGAPQPQFEQGG